MHKKLYLLLPIIVICLFLDSCTTVNPTIPNNEAKTVTIVFDTGGIVKINNQELYQYDKVAEPLLIYDEMYYEFLGWSVEKDNLVPYDFEEKVSKDMTLYGHFKSKVKDYSYYLDEYLPDVVVENLDLPRSDEERLLIWSSQNERIISHYGEVNFPQQDEKVFINLEVHDQGIITYYEKEVLVKAYELKPLKDSNLAFGYYASWSFRGYNEEMLKTLDVINLCFAYVASDFTLSLDKIPSMVNRVMEAHQYGIRVVLSVQGYGAEGKNFSNAAKTKEGRQKLANAMLETCQKYNFDGIDIDWEYPGFNTGTSTSVDRKNYTLLMEEINNTLKQANPNYLLTSAIPGGPYLPSRFDLKEASKHLDYIHMMTYDMHSSGKSTHHTALYDSAYTVSGCSINSSVNYFINQGVPKNKLIIGLAFYGRQFQTSSLGSSGSYLGSITYNVINNNYLSRINDGVKVYFDEIAKAAYLIDSVNNVCISYDNELSIASKCEYAIDNQLGGVMIWEISQDSSNALLKAIRFNLKN